MKRSSSIDRRQWLTIFRVIFLKETASGRFFSFLIGAKSASKSFLQTGYIDFIFQKGFIA